jgi:trimethylamine:corrinoid methyltransferase-like protein
MPRLMRVLMEWAFRAVGFAMIGVALAGAMREARAEALAGALI